MIGAPANATANRAPGLAGLPAATARMYGRPWTGPGVRTGDEGRFAAQDLLLQPAQLSSGLQAHLLVKHPAMAAGDAGGPI